MKERFSIAALSIACCLFCLACHKDKVKQPVQPEDTVTPVGTPVGQSTRKTIGGDGGELVSSDGTIRLIIPAGALNAPADIAIEPVTNELPEGIGHAYRLTPHGQQFSKPVTVIFRYKPEDTLETRPEFLDIAFQDNAGTWQMLTNTTVDKAKREIKAATSHFSDWGYFKSLRLTPAEAAVDQGGAIELKVTTTFPRIDPDDAPAGTYTSPVLKKPRQLRPDEIKGWDYAGEGKLSSEVAWAYYTAPDHEPKANPEIVIARINMHRKGLFMLICNITVLGGHGVDYLQVDEDYMSPLNKGMCMLYMYGTFGNDPGAPNRSVKINGTPVQADLWSPTVIRCKIDHVISGAIEIAASDHIVARSVLRKFKGLFIYERFHGGVINAGGSDPLKEMAKFTLVYRGFGKPCPSNIRPLFTIDGGLAEGTEVRYTLIGSASITTPPVDGCTNTTSVRLPTTSGWYFIEPHSMGGLTGFTCHTKDVQGGIEIKIWYVLDDIIAGVRVHRTSSCGLPSDDPPRSLGVGLEGFSNTAINLEFWGTDELKLKGTNQLKSNRMSSGILINAWDGTGSPSQYESDGLVPATFGDDY